MCDFKLGDEVVYVGPPMRPGWRVHIPRPEKDHVYVVGAVGVSTVDGMALVFPVGLEWKTRDGRRGGYRFDRWRKVERKRDLAAWLQTADHREPTPRCPKVLAVLRMVSQ